MIAKNRWTPYLAYGMAIDDYVSTDDSGISLKKEESVVIIERIHNWFRGYSTLSDKKILRIFPQSCIRLLNNASNSPIVCLNWAKLDQFSQDQAEIHKISLEVDAAIRDWYDAIYALLLKSDYSAFQKLLDSFYDLIEKKSQLISNYKTLAQKTQIKSDIVDIIECGNRYITKDLYLRQNGMILTNLKFMQLYKSHCERFIVGYDPPSLPPKDVGPTKIQVLVQLKGLTGVEPQKTFQVQIGIWNGKSTPLYQPALFKKSLNGAVVFADIDKKDIFSENMFLILRISQLDKGILKPLGNGSLELSQMLQTYLRDDPITKDLSIGISVPSKENDYQIFFGNIPSNSEKKVNAKLALSFFTGELSEACHNYPLFFHSAAINRQFGKVCFSETTKNTLHVNLHSADLSNQKKIGSIKNVQVQIEVKDSTGANQCCIFDGTHDVLHSSIRSVVFSSNDCPVWDIHLRIDLDPLIMLQSHLVITLGNTNEKGDFQPFSFAYLPLFYSQNEPVGDDCHALSLYKFDSAFARPSIYMTVPAGPSIFVPSGLSSLTVEELYNAAEYMASNNIKLKDSVMISTRLDSAMITKCQPLMMLLHWENVIKNHRGNIFSIIKDCHLMDECEKVKFHSQIVSSLADILDSEIGGLDYQKISACSLNLLVNILFSIKRAKSGISEPQLVEFIKSINISKKISQRLLDAVKRLLEANESDFTECNEKSLIELIKVWDLIFMFILSPLHCKTDRREVQFIASDIFDKLLKIMNRQKFVANFDYHSLIAENICHLLKIWIPFHPIEKIFDFMSDFLIAAKKNTSIQLIFMHAFILEDFLKDSTYGPFALGLISSWIHLYLTGKWTGKNLVNEYSRVSVKVLVFTTTQKRQELSKLLKFLSDFLNILYSLPSNSRFDKLSECLWILLETFCNYSDWKNMKLNSSRQSKIPSSFDDDRNSWMSSMDKASIDLSELASIIISFVDILPDQSIVDQFSKYLEIKGIEECAVYMAQWLDAISSLMTNIYPNIWVAMGMAVKIICLRSLTILSQFMLKNFATFYGRISDSPVKSIIGGSKIDGYHLWSRFFRSILTLTHIHHSIKSDLSYQYEIISSMSHVNFLKTSCDLIEHVWEALAKNVDYYHILKLLVPKFSAAFLEMALSYDENLQNVGIHLLFSMIKLEFRVNGEFTRVEEQIFEQMPWIVEKSKTASSNGSTILRFSHLFFEAPIDLENKDKFIEQGRKFIAFLEAFLSLSSEINSLSEDRLNIDEKAYATMKMIQFLSDLNKPEMLIVFIQSLYDLYLSQEQYIEAGILLKQYGDTLPWSTFSEDDKMETDELDRPKYRDEVYKRCVDMLDRGHSWERAIEICRELSDFFQYQQFNFQNVSEILTRQVEITEKIRTKDRYYPNYFLVSFFGYGFSNDIHGKVFVYKGLLWEKLGSFCERMLKRHPGSKLIKEIPSEFDPLENKKLILIRSIDANLDAQMVPSNRGSAHLPWPKINEKLGISSRNGPKSASDLINSPCIENKFFNSIPGYITAYFESNETNIFSYLRPIRRTISDDFLHFGKEAFDHLSNYSELTVLYTKERFPGLLSRSEVISTESFELNPIENAIITIKKKSKELSNFLKTHNYLQNIDGSPDSKMRRDSADTSNNSHRLSLSSQYGTNHFTMALNGAVDAPINGGIPMFRSAFFSDCYRNYAKTLGTEFLIEVLRKAIDEEVIIMHQCLKVHGGVISADMRPLHEQLIASFNKNFQEEINRINLRPLRQTPESMPLHWIARNSSDGGFSLKTSNSRNQSLVDLRKSGVSAVEYTSAGDELKRFSDMKRHTALNVLLMESSGRDTCEEENSNSRNSRKISGTNDSIISNITSESEKIEQRSSDGSITNTKGKFGKKLMMFIAPKMKKNN